MTAEVRRIDGSLVDTKEPRANQGVNELLSRVSERNEAGKVRGLVVVEITPAGRLRTQWHWPPDQAIAAVLGALDFLKHEIMEAAREDAED